MGDLFLLGSSLELEVKLPVCSSRSFRTRSLPSMLAKELSGIISLPRLGCGCRSGWQSSQISSAHSLENSRRNMKTKLLLLKLILIVLLKLAQRYRLYMMALLARRMSYHWLSSLVDLLYRTSLTKLAALKAKQPMFRVNWLVL